MRRKWHHLLGKVAREKSCVAQSLKILIFTVGSGGAVHVPYLLRFFMAP